MKNNNDTATTPVVATTNSPLNDRHDRRHANTENVSQRNAPLGLKTSKSGFPIAKADGVGRVERTAAALRRIAAPPKSEAGPIVDRPAAASSGPLAKSKPAPRLISPAHLHSAHKAARAFENFSLSKFAKDKSPKNYIDSRHVHNTKVVQDTQRELISRQLQQLSGARTLNSGMTITFPLAELEEIKAALPGMCAHGGEVNLDDLLTYLRERMNGTTFYSGGNPVMKRLTAATQARSQARAIIERVKNGPRQKRKRTAQSDAMQTVAVSKSLPNVHAPEKKGGSRS